MVVNKSEWKFILEHHDHTSKTSDIDAVCSFLNKLLKLRAGLYLV